MRKYSLFIMLIIAITSFGAEPGETVVYGSLNLNDEGVGYGVGTEYDKSITKIKNIDLSVALGLKYDSYDNGDDSEYKSDVSTMPVYLKMKGTYSKFFVSGAIGYTNPLKKDDSVLTNLKGGAYYGLALGMEKNNYLVELNYDVSNYEGDYSSSTLEYSDKARYCKTSIIFGYKFK